MTFGILVYSTSLSVWSSGILAGTKKHSCTSQASTYQPCSVGAVSCGSMLWAGCNLLPEIMQRSLKHCHAVIHQMMVVDQSHDNESPKLVTCVPCLTPACTLTPPPCGTRFTMLTSWNHLTKKSQCQPRWGHSRCFQWENCSQAENLMTTKCTEISFSDCCLERLETFHMQYRRMVLHVV